MSTSTLGLFLRHLALSKEASRLGTTSDHDLLAAYESERGQAAFTELMRRHGPMVLRTCRRLLGRSPDAEDAFQATFVLLARKAGQLRREAAGRQSLCGWLHRVAYNMALKVLNGEVRRRVRERQANVMTHPDPDPSDEVTWNEIQPILDAELDALPDEARRLLIACYLEEKTYTEAATELGLPRGSMAWRLDKARTLLAERLARRGITVSVALLAVVLGEAAKGAGLPAKLLVHTLEAARRFTEQSAGMVSDHVMRLVKGGLTQMAKGSKYPSVVLVGLVSLLGAGLIACQTLKAWPDQTPSSDPPAAERSAREDDKPAPTDRYGDPLPSGALARLGTMRLRQMSGVQSLTFSRDGKGLITAARGEPARLWDAATGRMLRQFGDGRDNPIHSAVLSPDGRILASKVGVWGGPCLWDVSTGRLLRRLPGSQAEQPVGRGRLAWQAAVTPAAFSPDGKTVAAMDGPVLRFWEVATGKELTTANQLSAVFFTFSADGKALIWADIQGGLHLWDVAAAKELRHWGDENKGLLSSLVLAPNGRVLAVNGPAPGAAASVARLWDVATGKEVRQVAADKEGITAAALSSDGKVLATSNHRGAIRLWDADTGKELRHCDGGSVQCLAFAPDGKTLASGSGAVSGARDQTVHLWDVGTGREIPRVVGHDGTVCSVAFTPDGQEIVSSGWDGSARLWDATTGKQRRHVVPVGDERLNGSSIAGIASAVSADGKVLLSAAAYRTEAVFIVKGRRWERASGRELPGWSQELGKGTPQWLTISPDGATVVCVANETYLWQAATGKQRARIVGTYQALSPDGKLAACLPQQREDPATFTLWETATGKELCSVKVPGGRVHHLLFSPDGRMLATASTGSGNRQSAIHLWPLARDEERKPQVRVGPPRLLAERILLNAGVSAAAGDHPGGIRMAPIRRVLNGGVGVWTFSPDNRLLALAGADGTVRLLETATGKERSHFAGHGGNVTVLSFSPDSRRLASGSRDTTILVWDVTGRLQGTHLRPARLSAKELEGCWADLAADDAGRAGRAIWTLAADSDQSAPFLAKRLQIALADAKDRQAAQRTKVPQLIRNLDDDGFAVREKAKTELARLGEVAGPALRQALAKSPSAETRRSLEQLLKTVEAKRQVLSSEALRQVRVVEVLEHIGSREARQALKTLTDDAPTESSLTQEVHATLGRLERAERQ